MKQIFSIMTKVSIALLSALFIFSSCEGPMGPRGYDGYNGQDGLDGQDGASTNWKIINYTLNTTDWLWDNVAECYYIDFDETDLTEFISEEGAVIASVYDAKSNTYKPLEFTGYYFDTGSNTYYAENISFEYYTKYIRFNVKSNDLFSGTPVTYLPASYRIKVTLMW